MSLYSRPKPKPQVKQRTEPNRTELNWIEPNLKHTKHPSLQEVTGAGAVATVTFIALNSKDERTEGRTDKYIDGQTDRLTLHFQSAKEEKCFLRDPAEKDENNNNKNYTVD